MGTPYLEVGRIYEQNLFFVQKILNKSIIITIFIRDLQPKDWRVWAPYIEILWNS